MKTKKVIGGLMVALMSIHSVLAATPTSTASTVDHLEVSVDSTSIAVGEATDITVKAVDKTGNTTKDYKGTVFIAVDGDDKAQVPFAQDGYTFTAQDQGVKKFSKGLSFTKEGQFTVNVIDIDDTNIEGSTKITVSAKGSSSKDSSATTSKSNSTSTGSDSKSSTGKSTNTTDTSSSGDEQITILSPESDSTLTDDKISVAGTTRKNSKVKVFLNDTEAGDSQTDETGKFTYELKGLNSDVNFVYAEVLDGDDKVIGTSDKVKVTIDKKTPKSSSINVKEGNEVKGGATLNVEVVADPGLKEVSISLKDATSTLKETSEGKYTGTITAPMEKGDYYINVNLKNELGKTTNKDKAYSLKVIPNVFENVKTESKESKLYVTFNVNPDSDDIKKFKIKYSTDSGSLDIASGSTAKEVLTYEKAKIKNSSGAYSWYISGLEPNTYYLKVFALDGSGSEMSGLESDVLDYTMVLNSAGKCTISNISGLKISKVDGGTQISWDNLPEAGSYNVYKKDDSGNWALIENVKTNKYLVRISGNDVKYDDFAIKGVCGDGTNKNESADYSLATKIKTGPEVLGLILISMLTGYVILRRRKA